ncbi:MAG: hypothetical protein IPM82_00280 [Saprospiraceae bacterium]|nr:hypothetical protein [Saprospiraceae bacterium]
MQQSNLETQIVNLDLQIKQAEQALKFAMNMPLETEIVLTDTISETMFDAVTTAMAQPGYSLKPDLLVLKSSRNFTNLTWSVGRRATTLPFPFLPPTITNGRPTS